MASGQSFLARVTAYVRAWTSREMAFIARDGSFERFMDDRVWRLTPEERGERIPAHSQRLDVRIAHLRASMRSCNTGHSHGVD